MKSAFRTLVTSLAAAFALFPPGLRAAEFYPVFSVWSDTIDTDYFYVENLIEGPGVGFDENPPHDRLSGSATWVTADVNGGAGNNYFDPHPDPPPRLVFDLGSDVLLTSISLWGYADTNANGVRDFSLRFATTADGEEGFGKSIAFNPTYTALHPATPRQTFPFGQGITARYVELTPLNNYFQIQGAGPGGDRVGIGEVAFEKTTVATGPKLEEVPAIELPGIRRLYPFTVQLRNIGDAELSISGTQITGPSAGGFRVVSAPTSIGALGAGPVELEYDPRTLPAGAVTASLEVSSNDAASPLIIPITGTVPPDRFHPIVSITSDTADTDYFPAANLIHGIGEGFSPEPPYDAIAGVAGLTLWVTEDTNGSTGANYFDPVPEPAPRLVVDLGADVPLFEISVWPYPASTSAANSTREFRLRFATAADGPDGFGTSIAFSPTLEAPMSESTEVVPRASIPFGQVVTARYVEISPLSNYYAYPDAGAGGDRTGWSEIAFEKSEVGTGPKLEVVTQVTLPVTTRTIPIELAVRNIGQEALSISGTTFTGAGAAGFRVVSGPTSIPPLSNATFQLEYLPAALPAGAFTAAFVITSNDPASPLSVPLEGIVPPALFHTIVAVESATADTDYYPAENLIHGIAQGFEMEEPHGQIIIDGPRSLWVTDAPWGGTADYFDPVPEPAPALTFDLGEDRVLGEISIWGYSSGNANGMADFSLAFATSAEGPAAAGTSIAYKPVFVAEFGDADRQSFPFAQSVTARYVVLTPLDNYYDSGLAPGGDRVGIGEVAFAIVDAPPPPAKFSILETAITAEGHIRIVFESTAGATYTVSRSTDLAQWTDFAPAVAGQPGQTEFVDTAPPAGGARVFYRVKRSGP